MVVEEEPPAVEELQVQAQYQLTVNSLSIFGSAAKKTLNTF